MVFTCREPLVTISLDRVNGIVSLQASGSKEQVVRWQTDEAPYYDYSEWPVIKNTVTGETHYFC